MPRNINSAPMCSATIFSSLCASRQVNEAAKRGFRLAGVECCHAPRVEASPLAQGAAQAVENGGLQQEASDGFGLTLQDLFHQIVHYVAVIAGEGRYESGNVLTPLHRQCCQLEPRDPTFGAFLQGRHISSRDVQPHHLIEESSRLVGYETQVGNPQFGQFPAATQTGERQGWVGPAGNDQVHLLR